MWKTTHWSQILEAQQENKYAIEALCRDYWQPVYKFVCKYYQNDAEDITQEFFTIFLENKWVERVSKTKGKFRTFLITALVRFIRDKKQKKQNVFENEIYYDYDNLESKEIKDFNQYWVEELLSLVEMRMHDEYRLHKNIDYFIFKVYYCYSSSIFFKPEDIIAVNQFFHDVRRKTSTLDQIMDEFLNRDCMPKTEKETYLLSQKLNQMLIYYDFEREMNCFAEKYDFCEVDFKTVDWLSFKNQINTRIVFFAKERKKIELTPSSILGFLNLLIQKKKLHEQINPNLRIQGLVRSMQHKNRLVLEDLFSEYLEKYTVRRNREIISDHYKSFFLPLFQKQPSYLAVANYFNISKHQVEKSLGQTVNIYKKIMRDEVARYVCPQEVTKEIAYLQNIL